ncbi:MAG: hypothetical protein ABIQ97_02850 [Lysobacteraceae bacterium]
MPRIPDALNQQSRDVLHALLDSPRLCLNEFDMMSNSAQLQQLDEVGYRESAFLDGRAVTTGADPVSLPLSPLLQIWPLVAAPRERTHFVFHIGHCGSTLVSRLLGQLPGIFSVREPPVLLQLAQMRRYMLSAPIAPVDALTQPQWRQLFDFGMTLLARSWRQGDVACIKPTSHANNLIADLLGWHPQSRAVLLFIGLERYLATMLVADREAETDRALVESRLADFARISRAAAPPIAQLAPGERAALVWLVEMHEFAQAFAAPATTPRSLALDFDRFLQNPSDCLYSAAEFLTDVPPDSARVDALLSGPLMRQYSKSAGAAYDAQVRQAALNSTASARQADIASGMRWAAETARRFPVFEAASNRF